MLRRVYLPWARIPAGTTVELPGRGTTYVTDTAGPSARSTPIVLLHALGCTGLLTWYPAIEALSRRFRVVTLDQRWHGQGIRSVDFSLRDCADDVAALCDVLGLDRVVVGGYSMGGVVAQRVWRQHPGLVAGLVLAATSDRFRNNPVEQGFFAGMGVTMLAARGVSRSRTAVRAARGATGLRPTDVHDWALRELRSTSPWAVGQALSALGGHHSQPWIGRIDAPTAVVATLGDRVIPVQRQLALARRIPGATVHEVDAGHAGCVLQAELFVPRFVEAATTVDARRRDVSR
ncbi:alpha/beta fold hydrolase [Nocardioides sp. Arc9.136]|uniref:alpha/beta fold hydrolase n=1 Tax=Nocardioides sp. Arc9.136 TaxID=2996826 RepID=UPI002664E840|nr:alpha/beta hydrolase [Nocardioides sp. Arc9.136]WKN50333.1 alpha/beta hydrolase [Nocardioides sp. Arc9.136]